MDAKAILDVLMQSGMGRSQQRLERAAGGGNPLLEAAVSMLGGSGGGGAAGGLGGLLSNALGGGSSSAGGGIGNVLGSLLGGGASAGAGGVGGGLIGMLAKAAMEQVSGGASAGGKSAAPGFDLSQFAADQANSKRDENDRALVMIRAMLSAAKADGQIDAGEQKRILGKLNEAGAPEAMQRFVQDELQKPLDVESIAAEVDSPHMATEVYTASLFAIDVDTPGEQAYMTKLADRLGLPSTLVRQLHDSLEVKTA